MSVSQVSPGLYLSGLDSALNLRVLTSRNITLVVNASGLDDVSYPQLDGLQVLHIPIQDHPHALLKQYFDPVAERIHQNQAGRTLVHCTAGRSRSPALIMAYLMRWTPTFRFTIWSQFESPAVSVFVCCVFLKLLFFYVFALHNSELVLVSVVSSGFRASASVRLMNSFYSSVRSLDPTPVSGGSWWTMRRPCSAGTQWGWWGRPAESCQKLCRTQRTLQRTVSTSDGLWSNSKSVPAPGSDSAGETKSSFWK